jgi:hypothetical protein
MAARVAPGLANPRQTPRPLARRRARSQFRCRFIFKTRSKLNRNDAVKTSEFDRMNRIDGMEKQIGFRNGASPPGDWS